MKRLNLLIILLAAWIGGSLSAQENVLKYFEGQWEGTVKFYNAKGKETGKQKLNRYLVPSGRDSLQGVIEYYYDKVRPSKAELIITREGTEFRQVSDGKVWTGTYKDKAFTFSNQETIESHFFVGTDQQFITIEKIDPKTLKRSVIIRGVLRKL
ncbi:MAG: hypothetical protein L0Y74_03110 [candidate division Zixibacteria bacterium]|nr:hypothetical protein [candidate division Zixibacteria bacterium]